MRKSAAEVILSKQQVKKKLAAKRRQDYK